MKNLNDIPEPIIKEIKNHLGGDNAKMASTGNGIPQTNRIFDKIDYSELYAVQQTIRNWKEARLRAQYVHTPDWTDLIRVYDYAILDNHITGIIASLSKKIKATEFDLFDDNDNYDEEGTKLFKEKWFFKVIDLIIKGHFYPYSLICLGDWNGQRFTGTKEIQPEYIIPQFDFVKKNLYISDPNTKHGWFYNERPIDKYYFLVNSDYKLGLMDRLVQHAIGKITMVIYWWRFAEIFGLPMRIGKTDIRDVKRRANMDNMLENMGNNFWATLDKEDDFELREAQQKSGASDFFDKYTRYANNEMSKAIAGATSFFDDKSYVGNAETSEDLFQEFKVAYQNEIEFVVKWEIIPRMKSTYLIQFKGTNLKFRDKEKISYQDRIKAIDVLIKTFNITPETIYELTGIDVEAKIITETELQKIKNTIASKYKNIYGTD